MNRGRHGEARRLLQRAADTLAREEVPQPDLGARVATSLAYVLSETGEHDAAMTLCRGVLGDEAVTGPTRGVLHSQLGLLLMLRGEHTAALSELASALELVDEPGVIARIHLNRGNVYLQRRVLPEAIDDFEVALASYRDAGDEYGAAKAAHNLGYVRFLAGDLVGALRDLGAAYPTFEAEGPVMTAMADQDRAEVLMAAGLHVEGAAALAAAADAYGRRRLYQRRGEAEVALARSLLLRDPTQARAAARDAIRRFRRTGARAWETRAEAISVSADVERGGRGLALAQRAAALADELAAQGLRWESAQARIAAARVRIGRGDLEPAREHLRAVGAVGGAPIAVRLLARDARAELAATAGRRADGLRHLRSGLTDLHEWQSSFGSLDLQTGIAGHGQRLGVRGLALAVASGSPATLFEWSERARMLASRVQPVRAPEDEQIAADLAELREMAAEEARRDPGREAELRQRVRERAWQHRGSGEVADPVSLEELVGELDRDTALVAYVVTRGAVVALVGTSAGPTWVDIGHRDELDPLLAGLLPDLDMAATELPDAMAAFVRQELAERLATLADLLVAPVLDAVGDRRVVLTPSGVLAGVPWTLLPGYAGRPVTVAQSATAWLGRRTPALRTASAGFVAGPRVARAEDEVIAASKEWAGARLLTGTDATTAAVCELAESVDVLHVAAHGRHSAENAMFAGLQLADGPWFGYDIDRLHPAPDVVLLSACEVGRSSVRSGEELIGMTTAWLHAGARCVIASSAAINDAAAYDVLVAVHQRLAAGLDPAAALAEAVPAVCSEVAPVPLTCFG